MISPEKMDVRFKMACMAILSIAVLKADATGLIFLSILCLGLWMSVRFPVRSLIRHFYYLVFLLVIVFLARALTVSSFSGPAGTLVSMDPKGAVAGLLICWRLIILTFLGVLWMSTTSPSGIRMAVEWFCRPFPGLSGKQVATMMSLMVRFLPVIVEQARETSAAQQCRCIQNRKNPVYRTVKFSLPLLCRTLWTADRLADAMEARCYSPENNRPLALKSGRSDWLILIGTTGFCALMICL
ncbi:MAG: energy-coupling factor transporter transmembrane protein EcfT [Deltaproteobacteria bacterium]|nr:energy-coupling factor transporter transmembrane protein EcfT [Deltaproteobacteria bacterium]